MRRLTNPETTKRRHKTSAYLFKRFNYVILNKYLNIAVKLFHLINLDLRARLPRDFSFTYSLSQTHRRAQISRKVIFNYW